MNDEVCRNGIRLDPKDYVASVRSTMNIWIHSRFKKMKISNSSRILSFSFATYLHLQVHISAHREGFRTLWDPDVFNGYWKRWDGLVHISGSAWNASKSVVMQSSRGNQSAEKNTQNLYPISKLWPPSLMEPRWLLKFGQPNYEDRDAVVLACVVTLKAPIKLGQSTSWVSNI